jgi:hypothetical protein
MSATLRIHPSIGIARLGNSPSSFYIAPESAGGLPIECDQEGNTGNPEKPVARFKDSEGRIRRQAARFRIYVYDDHNPEGRELKIGDEIETVNTRSGQSQTVRVDDVQWTAYLANKKSSWYAFQQTDGEHGYAPDHPLRNASITNAEERQRLIIDPGPRTVSFKDQKKRKASFSPIAGQPSTFPPPLTPNSVTTLGDLLCIQQEGHSRLLVLGGMGNSGSMFGGFGNPKIESFANNDGWFDDISDGPVTTAIAGTIIAINGHRVEKGNTTLVLVNDPAWVIVGYPRYAPEIVDIITMDDLLYDLSVRNFAYAPYLYGVPPFDGQTYPPRYSDDPAAWRSVATWNREYRPYFWTEIWPILQRPFQYQFVMDKDPTVGGDPHETGPGGTFDETEISVVPYEGEDPVAQRRRADMRHLIYAALRKQGRENDLNPEPLSALTGKTLLYAMPLLAGDNPLTNVAPSKFLRLTDTMLFILHQWAEGLFINEKTENIEPVAPRRGEGHALDRGCLGSVVGGSFCPGAETSWIMRNPAIFASPYRIQHAPAIPGLLSHPAAVNYPDGPVAQLSAGLEPGDITKYSGVPWQADFNECTTQPVDVTYRDWNQIDPQSIGDPIVPVSQNVFWWPAHRPNFINAVPWSPTTVTNSGDLEMVSVWSKRGFVVRDPSDPTGQSFIISETGD